MLRGTLDDFTLADVFKLLSFSKKTGRVELKRRAGIGRVFFRDGDVYYAESSLSREPLGQKLVRSRALTESHLRRALDEHADTGERVGQILLREGWINEEQLEDAVRQQIEDSVFDLLRWELGDFEWEPNATLEPEVPISVSVENLIMEASRRLDELEIISRKVPTSHAVVAVAPVPPEGAVEINITPDEWRVLVLVDGHRTVETIANTIGLDEFHTMKIVHGMVSAGLVEVIGTDEAQQPLGRPAASEIQNDEVEAMAPPPPPRPVAETLEPAPQVDEAPDAPSVPAAEPQVEEDLPSSFAYDEEEISTETPFEAIAPEAVTEPQEEALADDQPSSPNDEPAADATPAQDSADEAVTADEDFFPQGEDVLEETLYEADVDPKQPPTEAGSPPAEWFSDPDISMELFDSPSPGDLLTEFPHHDAGQPTAADEVPSFEALETLEALEASESEIGAVAPQAGPDGVDGLVELPAAPEAEAPAPTEPQVPKTPPPPPVPPVEGEERTRAVRELSGLFDDDVIERPKRPVIRRIEPSDATARRRVEDDEQVTKSLISRLIEGVKGL
jgi:Domain of unknown function (DUF4388)